MFSGLSERLTKEVKNLVPESMKNNVKVIAVPERKYSVWIWGSILLSISTFSCIWITRDEYYESSGTFFLETLIFGFEELKFLDLNMKY